MLPPIKLLRPLNNKDLNEIAFKLAQSIFTGLLESSENSTDVNNAHKLIGGFASNLTMMVATSKIVNECKPNGKSKATAIEMGKSFMADLAMENIANLTEQIEASYSGELVEKELKLKR